jgi:hypothetical protein
MTNAARSSGVKSNRTAARYLVNQVDERRARFARELESGRSAEGAGCETPTFRRELLLSAAIDHPGKGARAPRVDDDATPRV